MHVIKPITALSAAEIHDLAQAAADRGEAHDDANPFDPQSAPDPHHAFAWAFHGRTHELTAAA